MGRLVVNKATTVNGAFEAPAPEPDGGWCWTPDSNSVSLEQFLVADVPLGRAALAYRPAPNQQKSATK
jgi:hypothetical protein